MASEIESGPPDPGTVHTLIMKGGGVKGLAFAGAIEVLAQSGYKFNTFVGTSAGSVGAVLLAAGFSPSDLQGALRGQEFRAFLDASLPLAIANFIVHGGLYPGRSLRTWVERLLWSRFDATQYPVVQMKSFAERFGNRVVVFATHPRLGTLTFDSAGSNATTAAAHAVRLSSSIPGFFIPEKHDGTRIYDGGLLNNFPIEVYQRIQRENRDRSRGENSDGQAESDDFIAMYIGRPVGYRPEAKWWFREVLDIMLARDDTIQLQTHRSRTVIIDAHPIGATDFKLSDTEKDLLVEAGREAAWRFLNRADQVAKCREKLEPLREAAARIRARRVITKFSKRVLAGAALVAVVLIGLRLVQPRPQYAKHDGPLHKQSYINRDEEIAVLDSGARQDMQELNEEFGDEYDKGAIRFNSVLQILLIRRERSAKLELLDGNFDDPGGPDKVTITSSVAEGNSLRTEGELFVATGKNDWRAHQCNWSLERSPKTQTKTAHLSDSLGGGSKIRVVAVTEYPGSIFQYGGKEERAVPWLLNSHRFLAANGTSTYVFLRPDDICVPRHLYVRDSSEAYVELVAPKGSANARGVWQRALRLTEFLNGESVKERFPEHAQQLLVDILKATQDANANQAAAPDRHFLFTFDAAETRKLGRLDKLNVFVFAEDQQ